VPVATSNQTPTVSIVGVIAHWPHLLGFASFVDVVAVHDTFHLDTMHAELLPFHH
jgi:hypothetical protein